MRIALVGSMAFADVMSAVRDSLQALGATVTTPIGGGDVSPKAELRYNVVARTNINESDAILVINETKHGIHGYVGANALIEIGMAFAFHKQIYLLNPYDDLQPNAIELAGLTDGIAGDDINVWFQSIKKETR